MKRKERRAWRKKIFGMMLWTAFNGLMIRSRTHEKSLNADAGQRGAPAGGDIYAPSHVHIRELLRTRTARKIYIY